MKNFRARFVISKLCNEEFTALQKGHVVVTKMILTPQDFEMFHYVSGDSIEVETIYGNRLWCTILNLETIPGEEQVTLIFTLLPTNSTS